MARACAAMSETRQGFVIPSGGYKLLPWKGFAYEHGENFGTSGDDFFTIAEAGVFEVHYQVGFLFAGSPTTGSYTANLVVLDDEDRLFGVGQFANPNPFNTMGFVAGSRLVEAEAGDRLGIQVREDMDTPATVDSRKASTHFSITRVR